MKQFKFIFYLPENNRIPVKALIFASPFIYVFHTWFVTLQRKKFKRKIEERDYNARLKFQEFSESLSLSTTSILKDFRNENNINLTNFSNNYLILYHGDIEYYPKLFEEYERVTEKTIKNVKFLYILESELMRNTLLKFPNFLKEDQRIIAYIPEEDESKKMGLKKNSIYAISPENKLFYFKNIKSYYTGSNYFNRIIKDINLKIRKDVENSFIKKFDF